MTVERARALLLSLPHVVETMQWGDKLVFWAGDKAIGGKMFALVPLDAKDRAGSAVISFAAGPAHFHDLLEVEGCIPAPYLARVHWIAVTAWDAFSPSEWQGHLRRAHALTLEKLPRKTLAVLSLPTAEARRQVAAARRVALAKASGKKPAVRKS